jgi:acyl-CoA synthetase (AMP-forming)/AMP-acid ligase II
MASTTASEILVFDDANAETAGRLLEDGVFDRGIRAGTSSLDRDEVERYEEVLSDAGPELHPSLPADGKACVFFTSGTTTEPKAVAFDSEQMWIGAYQVVMEHGIDETDIALAPTPWYHMVTTDAWLYPHWLAGASTVVQSTYDPAATLNLLEDHDVTGLLAVPTQLDDLCSLQADLAADVDSLSYVRTGGSKVPPSLVDRVTDRFTENLYNTYGLTEAGPNLSFAHPTAQLDHKGTVGKESFSWELRVVETVDLDRQPDPEATVESGQRGEIIARGPGLPDGYVDSPAAEKRSFFGEWLRTGDVAEVDEEGYLYVVDRVDNMIISGGENIYPKEVERALTSHAAVEEALVFGREDDHWGEQVTAIVVVDESVDVADLDAYCRAHDSLADFKRPREYAVRSDPLPRTDTGTVARERAIEEHFE